MKKKKQIRSVCAVATEISRSSVRIATREGGVFACWLFTSEDRARPAESKPALVEMLAEGGERYYTSTRRSHSGDVTRAEATKLASTQRPFAVARFTAMAAEAVIDMTLSASQHETTVYAEQVAWTDLRAAIGDTPATCLPRDVPWRLADAARAYVAQEAVDVDPKHFWYHEPKVRTDWEYVTACVQYVVTGTVPFPAATPE